MWYSPWSLVLGYLELVPQLVVERSAAHVQLFGKLRHRTLRTVQIMPQDFPLRLVNILLIISADRQFKTRCGLNFF